MRHVVERHRELAVPQGAVRERWAPGQGDSLAPPGFVPQAPRPGGYVQRNPTRYNLRPDIAELVRACYRLFGGPRRLHVCTYLNHPPNHQGKGVWLGIATAYLSLDGWGPDGRGDPMPDGLHADLWNFLFDYEHGPDLWWGISNGWMWTRERPLRRDAGGHWSGAPVGAADSDWQHVHHPHKTFHSLAEQRILRPGYTIEEGIANARRIK